MSKGIKDNMDFLIGWKWEKINRLKVYTVAKWGKWFCKIKLNS